MTMSAVKTTPITRMAPMGNFCRTAPKLDEATPSGGGPRVGRFWHNCKSSSKCVRAPYDRLLTNPVLRADYRTHRSGTRDS